MRKTPTKRNNFIKLLVLTLALPLLLPVPCARATGQASAELMTAAVMVQRGIYGPAATILRTVVEDSPDDPQAAYYLGLALNRTTAGKESETLLKVALRENPENPAVNFELGLHYYAKEVPSEASDYFEQVIDLAPASLYAVQARAYLKKIEERSKEKPWELTVLSGLQYDSNVILTNGSAPLPAGYSRQGDWSALVNLRAAYTPIKTGNAEVATGYSLYQSLYSTLTDLNVTQNLWDLSASYALAPRLKLKGVYSFEYLLLGGASYDYAHTFSPSLSSSSEKWGTTTLDYHYSRRNYWNSEKFSTNTDRNGENHLFGLSHLLSFSKSRSAWMLYTHDTDLTQNPVWGYQGNRALIGCRSPLPFGFVGDLSGDVVWKQYEVADPSFGVRRQDTQYTISLSLVKSFSARYSLTLGEVLSRNRSNIADFSYTRAITSALVSARF